MLHARIYDTKGNAQKDCWLLLNGVDADLILKALKEYGKSHPRQKKIKSLINDLEHVDFF